ncbi:MAG: MATE family efflux transporter [Bacillota bacterium]
MNATPETNNREQLLATEKTGKLILKFAIPAIISFLVNAAYNIVDQIFIGQGVGIYGNGATNVAFPFNIVCTALALLLGIGAASNFNLRLGAGRREEAGRVAAAGLFLLAVCGTALAALIYIFLTPLLYAFGATENVFPYALTYTSIVTAGYPLIIFTIGGGHLIRADGSPTYSMICVLSGAILNTILDPLFIFGFHMGIAGAAWATVIGQLVSAVLVVRYFFRFKTMKLEQKHFRPSGRDVMAILSLGVAAFFNQISLAVVQMLMNNALTFYGAQSQYGADIPLACVGVISKVNTLFLGFTIGIAQGCQPINGFNYGAKNYGRVKETYTKGLFAATGVSILFFLAFQLFPREIVSIFGQGSALYFQFAERYMRIFMLLTFINGIQPVTANFFTSIGKAKVGLFISLTRQLIFLLPLILLLPLFYGIDGLMVAGPVADSIAAILAIAFALRELRLLTLAQKERNAAQLPAA